jgi:hypothetical protein
MNNSTKKQFQSLTQSKNTLIVAFFLLLSSYCLAVPVLTMTVRATGTGSTFYFYLNVKNTATNLATDKASNLVVTAQLPAGATFVSANLGGTLSGSTITWNIDNLAGKGMVTPTFVCNTTAASITLVASTTGVTCTEDATPSRPAADVVKNRTAPGPTVEVATTAISNADADANILSAGNAFSLPAGSTHPDHPYLTWVGAMTRVHTNNVPCQTVKFRYGTYTDGANDVQTTSKFCNFSNSNSYGTNRNLDGLTIDGQGSMINGNASTNNFFKIVSAASGQITTKDVTIKNIIFEKFKDSGSDTWSVMGFTDVDGLVIDNCIFYASIAYQPLFLSVDNTKAVAMTVSNCIFSGNSQNTESGTSGGMEVDGNGSQSSLAVYVNIDKSLFSCNRRNAAGGGLRLYGSSEDARTTSFNITDCTFQGNTSSTTGSGGAALYIGAPSSSSNPGSLNVFRSKFYDNLLNGSTSANGGGFLAAGNIVNFNNSEFDGNGALTTTPGLRGGAFALTAGALSITNTTFTNNYATTSHGGVYQPGGTAVELDSDSFSNNTGGASCNSTTAAFTNTTIAAGAVPTPVAGSFGGRSGCSTYSRTMTITGNVFDDGNGYTDNLVNGTGVTTANAGTLYVAVVSASGAVVGTATVSATGTYTITTDSGLATNATGSAPVQPQYTLVLTTTAPSIGGSASASVPTGWQSTSENYGTPTTIGNDGTTNTVLSNYSVVLDGTDVTNLNFAINKLPISDNRISTAQPLPTGTTSVAVNGLTTSTSDALFIATDLETTVSSILLTAFPSNATSFTVGATTYYPTLGDIPGGCVGCAVFPGTLSVPTNGSGVPTSLSVDPSLTANGNVVFSYSYTDAAGATATGSATIPFELPLPIELLSFSGKKQNKGVALFWQTATEINNDRFEIQRSTDGRNFTTLAKVAGAGTTTVAQSYEYFDATPAQAITNYYRLKQVDFDGTGTLSNTIAVSLNPDGYIVIKGNPVFATLQANIIAVHEFSGKADVVNMLGNVVATQNVHILEGENTLQVDVNYLPTGVYQLRISNGQFFYNSTFLKK